MSILCAFLERILEEFLENLLEFYWESATDQFAWIEDLMGNQYS